MEELPLEIQKQIAVFACDSARRCLRLASMKWFKIVDYRDFNIYLTKKADWQQIVDRFETYTNLISLSLKKNVMQCPHDIFAHLTRLTNMSSFDIDQIQSSASFSDWMKLTAMTNLKFISNDFRDMPFNIWKQLTQLEAFESFYQLQVPFNEITDATSCLTNLQKLTLCTDSQINFPFANVGNSNLTYLHLLAHKTVEWTNEDLQRFSNVKQFFFNETNLSKMKSLSLDAMTALEELSTSFFIESVNSTRLTALRHITLNQIDESLFPKLGNLKSLSLQTVHDHSECLTALTQLEEFSIGATSTKQKLAILGNILSTNLLSLEVSLAYSTIDFGYLTQLTSLQHLTLYHTLCDDIITVLTNLEKLNYSTNNLETSDVSLVKCLPTLTKLRELHYLPNIATDISIDLSPLTNLERLDLEVDSAVYFGLSQLTKLTYLALSAQKQDQFAIVQEISVLTNLQTLSCKLDANLDYRVLTAMTNLKNLTVHHFNNEEDVLYLTTLRLTHLVTLKGLGVNGYYLTRLTSLQDILLRDSNLTPKSLHEKLPNLRHCTIHAAQRKLQSKKQRKRFSS